MDEAEREQLAQQLSAASSLREALKEVRALDPDADMKFWRNSIWGQYHTLFTLPNVGLSITLIETDQTENTQRNIGGGPRGSKAEKVKYYYKGARVDVLTHPAHKRGGTGPSPFAHRERALARTAQTE
jgi:hypothetical protein